MIACHIAIEAMEAQMGSQSVREGGMEGEGERGPRGEKGRSPLDGGRGTGRRGKGGERAGERRGGEKEGWGGVTSTLARDLFMPLEPTPRSNTRPRHNMANDANSMGIHDGRVLPTMQ